MFGGSDVEALDHEEDGDDEGEGCGEVADCSDGKAGDAYADGDVCVIGGQLSGELSLRTVVGGI